MFYLSWFFFILSHLFISPVIVTNRIYRCLLGSLFGICVISFHVKISSLGWRPLRNVYWVPQSWVARSQSPFSLQCCQCKKYPPRGRVGEKKDLSAVPGQSGRHCQAPGRIQPSSLHGTCEGKILMKNVPKSIHISKMCQRQYIF